MVKQKYHKGDLVQVLDYGKPTRAIVIASYAEQFGGTDKDLMGEQGYHDYTVFLEGQGECSWFSEGRLELISSNRLDLLEEWKKEQEERLESRVSTSREVFEKSAEILTGKAPRGTIDVLADDLGVAHLLWSGDGSAFSYLVRAHAVAQLAIPFLRDNDLAGWLEYCKRYKENKEALCPKF